MHFNSIIGPIIEKGNSRYKRYSGRMIRLQRYHGRKTAQLLARRYSTNFRKFVFPVIKKFIQSTLPSMNEFMSVQPMSKLTGSVFYLDIKTEYKKIYNYRYLPSRNFIK